MNKLKSMVARFVCFIVTAIVTVAGFVIFFFIIPYPIALLLGTPHGETAVAWGLVTMPPLTVYLIYRLVTD